MGSRLPSPGSGLGEDDLEEEEPELPTEEQQAELLRGQLAAPPSQQQQQQPAQAGMHPTTTSAPQVRAPGRPSPSLPAPPQPARTLPRNLSGGAPHKTPRSFMHKTPRSINPTKQTQQSLSSHAHFFLPSFLPALAFTPLSPPSRARPRLPPFGGLDDSHVPVPRARPSSFIAPADQAHPDTAEGSTEHSGVARGASADPPQTDNHPCHVCLFPMRPHLSVPPSMYKPRPVECERASAPRPDEGDHPT